MRYDLLLALVFYVGMPAVAHQQEQFLQANKAYAQGDYDTALQRYADLADKGGGVYFNMGNAYYKKGDYAQALLHWRKAQRLLRGAPLRMVLEQSKKAEQLLSARADTSVEPLVRTFGPYVSYVPLLLIQLIWLFFACGIVVGGFTRIGSQRAMILLGCLMGLASCGVMLALKHHILLDRSAQIMNTHVSLFAGPNDQYHVLASLDAGRLVTICHHGDKWCKVSCGSRVGWMPVAEMTPI